MVKKIKCISTSNDQIMVSFDVDSLYTNVPVKESIDIAVDMLYKNRTSPAVDLPFNRTQMKHLLEFAVCNVPFRFLDKYYVQCDGVAMGSPLGPILADLFMSKLEEKVNKFSTNKPSVWYRYVDDVFCIFKTNQNIDDFLKRINKWHDNITFTKETESNDRIAFLDVSIIRNTISNKYDTTIYRKPTNTNLYLLYESNQCRKYKIGLIKSLVTRILLICSTTEYSEKEIQQMKETLETNGYPAHLVRRGIREGNAIVKKMLNNTQPNNTATKTPLTNVFFIFSYYGHESIIFAERIRKICKRLLPLVQVNIAFKKTFTLKSVFLPKQKGTDPDKTNKKLIYRIPCKDCDQYYYGETGRAKIVRMKEHQTNIKKQKDTSELVQHILKEKHTFDFDNVDTINHEVNWQRRVIKESIYTYESNGKALNEVNHKLNVFG